jgi:HD-GYP domain-containing protein (c-di-GMP phosphodiesterase class II)
MRLFRTIMLVVVALITVPLSIVGFILVSSNLDALKTLTMELPQQTADQAARMLGAFSSKMIWEVVGVVVVSLIASVGVGVVFALRLTRPLAKFVTGALAIARGNFNYTIDIRARNEIGELAHTFNYMSRQLFSYDQENKSLVSILERGYLETIRALANSIDAKDPYTRGHSARVTNVALAIGRELQIPEDQLRILSYAGTLHDIGKIGIPEGILGKKALLDEKERHLIQQHPVFGERIIEPIDFLAPVRSLVRHHHERYDGSGYPDGLKGEQIPLMARILNAADTYDAITSTRPYQAAQDDQQAITILQRLRGKQIDPQVCDALVTVIQNKTDTQPVAEKKIDNDAAAPLRG